MRLIIFYMRLFLVFILFCSVLGLQAQVQVTGQATGKHARAVNAAKESRAAAKARRQQVKTYKKQVKQHKKAQKLFSQKYDSLKGLRMDSLEFETLSIDDSLAISEEIFETTNFPVEYKELILEPPVLSIDSINTAGVSNAVATRSEGEAERIAKDIMPDELGASQDPMENLTNPIGQQGGVNVPGVAGTSPNATAPRISKPNPNLVKPEVARELFKKVDPKQFQDAQANIQQLKKKYSELPDTRYPEEGTKRNSLENVPFSKRLYVGGNINFASTDPLIVSSDVQLGYWINKKWMAGAGITLREQFNNNDSTTLVTGDGYGYSFFTRYDIPKGFFFWAESEFQINRSVFGESGVEDPSWQRAYLLGIGREFTIGPVSMMSIILYDFNYQNNDLHARPLVLKVGFRFSKKPG